MSQVQFFALGGLGEDGKNMYVFSVDGRLFIFDAGIKYPDQELLGVEAILPDYQYLLDHQSQIEGFFLSHGHEDHIGAMPKILTEINAPVYGSFFTLALLRDSLKHHKIDESKLAFRTVTKNTVLDFKSVKVRFYQTTHSIPGSLGMALETKEGSFVYSPDYTFDQNVDPIYQTSFDKIHALTHKPVIGLFSESLGAIRKSTESVDEALEFHINQVFRNRSKRIIVSAFSTDIYRIQRVINIALKYERKIAIIGRKAQRMIDIAINNDLLKIPDDQFKTLKFIDPEDSTPQDDNVMILVAGDRHEPFHMIQRMALKHDRLVHLTKNDLVLLMTPAVPGTEKIASRMLDILYRSNIDIQSIDKAMLPPAHATSSDVKLLNNILKPKYFIPVIGEWRHFYEMKKIAEQLNYPDNHILELENGQVLTFEAGKLVKSDGHVKVGEILVDGSLESGIHDVVLKDREILSQDGVLIISGAISLKKRKFLAEPELTSRGFVYVKENEALLDEVSQIFKLVVEKALKAPHFDFKETRDQAKDAMQKYISQKTSRRPIVMPMLVTVEDPSYA